MTLEIDGVTVTYGSVTAVDAVSLTVERGDIHALVGPSGCGKSTLLRAVAGLVEPDSGVIRWAGRDLTDVATERRSVGLMFQDHALFVHRNVADNVAFGLRMHGMARAERRRRVDELLELVGLAGFGSRSVSALSGGEAQRVALARALAPEPEVLLLDEPLASLDRALRQDLNEQLGLLLRSVGQTALYVTHDQQEAFAIADRVGIMMSGQVERDGPPIEVWCDPRTEAVARFVGHGPIVDIDGRRFAVRSDAVRLGDLDAPRVGRVVECRFQGDRHRISVEAATDTGPDTAGAGHRFTVWQRDPVDVGSRVGIELDADRLAPLD